MEAVHPIPLSLSELPIALSLTDLEVHVWQATLDMPPEVIHSLMTLLSPDEQARAARFRFEAHQHRFVAGRGILRSILACYLGLSPAQLEFSYSPNGKPALVQQPSVQHSSRSVVSFNVSHSGNLALYAVGRGDRLVGIDLERRRVLDNVLQLAQRFFSKQEYAAIATLPSTQQQDTFFRLWTYKEAYLKATGEGLTGLERVEVILDAQNQASLRLPKDVAFASWSLIPLYPHPDYAAALAVTGTELHLAHYSVMIP